MVRIQSLSLSDNELGDSAAVMLAPGLADNCCLVEMDLSWNKFRGRGAAALCRALWVSLVTNTYYIHQLCCFMSIILHFTCSARVTCNHFSHSAGYCPLQEHATLQRLNVSWNGFGEDGADDVSKLISLNDVLEHLDVR